MNVTNRQVLVIGGGISGLSIARSLAAAGRPCLLLENQDHLGGVASFIKEYRNQVAELAKLVIAHPLIRVELNSRPVKIEGVRGEFNVSLDTETATALETCSEIVIATGLEIDESPRITLDPCEIPALSLLTLEKMRCGMSENVVSDGGRVVILPSIQTGPDGFFMYSAMKMACFLKETGKKDIVIITDLVRLDEAWSSGLYQRCRSLGIRFIKSEEPPMFYSNHGDCRFRVRVKILDQGSRPAYIEGSFDLLVTTPKFRPINIRNLFWSPHQMELDTDGYQRQDNLGCYPVFTERAGIYVIGSAGGMRRINQCLEDASIAAGHILSDPGSHPYAVVDKDKCAICLTCVRTCPHRAISLDRVASIVEAACSGCGNCVPECPAQAITLRGAEHVVQKVAPGNLVVFCCEGSTALALERALSNGPVTKRILSVRQVPCSGNVSIVDILEALKAKALGVFIATCHDGNCLHMHGDHRVRQRVTRIQDLLREVGRNPNQIHIDSFSSSMPLKLAYALRGFEESLLSTRS